MELDAARVGGFADPLREVAADARHLEQAGFVEFGDAHAGVGDDLGRVAVRADLERVLALDLEQVADLGEEPREREVVHGGIIPTRPGAPGAGRSVR